MERVVFAAKVTFYISMIVGGAFLTGVLIGEVWPK